MQHETIFETIQSISCTGLVFHVNLFKIAFIAGMPQQLHSSGSTGTFQYTSGLQGEQCTTTCLGIAITLSQNALVNNVMTIIPAIFTVFYFVQHKYTQKLFIKSFLILLNIEHVFNEQVFKII